MGGGSVRNGVGYRLGGDNSEVLLALLIAARYRCIWCTSPIESAASAEIDHLIPRTTDPRRLRQLIDEKLVPSDFDLDDPANLAAICPTCNSQKGPRDHTAE